jgi:hypothetical protein
MCIDYIAPDYWHNELEFIVCGVKLSKLLCMMLLVSVMGSFVWVSH